MLVPDRCLGPRHGGRPSYHVMVTRAGSSGYLLLEREDGGTFDIWLETEEEVAEALAELAPRWELATSDP